MILVRDLRAALVATATAIAELGDDEELLSRAEAALVLGCSRELVRLRGAALGVIDVGAGPRHLYRASAVAELALSRAGRRRSRRGVR